MKRTVAMLGMLLAVGCGSDDDEKNDTAGDGDTGDGDAQSDAGDGDAQSDAGPACVDDSKDTVSNPGFSCNVGTTCVHYIGSGWTAADVKASCDRTAIPAMATACVNEGFCARTTENVCKIPSGEGKDVYGFGMPAPLCMGIGGTIITKPAEGWPADYDTLSPAGDAGT